ncbi:MAG: lipopolysaccharide biosynthesis protein [Steroidobacterales bacterium]
MSASALEQVGNLREKLRALRRRRVLFAGTFAAALLLALAFALLWPATYRSTGTILIEQQEIPQDLVRSTITSYADQRVQVIGQRVQTTQNLLKIIDQYGLYPRDRSSKPREALLKEMRGDIAVNMISADVIDPRSGRPTQATIAFSVAYQSRSPELAVKVANELTTLYLNENLTNRTQLAAQTTTFLGDESETLRKSIVALEARLADFKRHHATELPDQTTLNTQLMDRTELDLQDSENRIGSLDGQRAILQAQLAQLNPTSQLYSDSGQRILSAEDRLKVLKSDLASLSATYGSDHPDVLKTQREIAGLEQQVHADGQNADVLRQLADAKAQLAEARQRYSADHPDVLRLQRAVSNLETEAAKTPVTATTAQARTAPDNMVYIQVKGQLDSIEAQRTAELKKQEELRARLDDFQKRLAAAPEVEKEYRVLARDYDNAQARYQLSKTKQGEAQVAENLETERKGERFTLIEPPLTPEEPISPNRPLVMILGFVLAAGLGLGAVALSETFDTSIRGAADLGRLTEVMPLVSIPLIETRDDRRRRRRLWRYSWQGSAAVLLLTILAIHFFVRPLDVLWVQVMRRLGA